MSCALKQFAVELQYNKAKNKVSKNVQTCKSIFGYKYFLSVFCKKNSLFVSQVLTIFAVSIAVAYGKPGLLPVAYTAPVAPVVAAAPVVTATSSQVVARNYNGIAHAPIAYTAPLTYAAPVAAAYTSPVFKYAAAPAYFSPAVATHFASPLKYTAAHYVL